MGKVVLVTGGVRSGKSSFSLDMAKTHTAENRVFIATAEVCDDEMAKRAKDHQKERGESWQTVESGAALAEAITTLPSKSSVIVDCLTVWLGNVWYKKGDSDEILNEAIEELALAVQNWQQNSEGQLVFVTNEVGWGIVPESAAVRQFRDWAGRLNQRVASLSDEVHLVICGIATKIK